MIRQTGRTSFMLSKDTQTAWETLRLDYRPAEIISVSKGYTPLKVSPEGERIAIVLYADDLKYINRHCRQHKIDRSEYISGCILTYALIRQVEQEQIKAYWAEAHEVLMRMAFP